MIINRLWLISILFLIITSCNQSGKEDEKTQDMSDLSNLSIEEITALIREQPKNAVLYDARADIYLKNGIIDSAIHSLEIAVAVDSLEPSYYIKLSDLYLRNKGQSGKTKNLLEKCIRLFPKNIQAHLNLANLNLYVRQYDKALELLDKIRDMDKYNPHQFFTRAIVFLEMGDTAKALANFQTTVELEASYFNAHMELGKLFSYLRDSIALQYFRNAINLVPESIDAHYSIAMFYQEAGNFSKAKEFYETITNIDSLFFPSYHNIGYMHLYREEFQEGISYFSKAISINPNYIEAYLHRGICHEELKNYNLAEADYRACLKIVDNYELAIAGLNRLDKHK
jgi:tetratricopeptide (TPR) repeat protein